MNEPYDVTAFIKAKCVYDTNHVLFSYTPPTVSFTIRVNLLRLYFLGALCSSIISYSIDTVYLFCPNKSSSLNGCHFAGGNQPFQD